MVLLTTFSKLLAIPSPSADILNTILHVQIVRLLQDQITAEAGLLCKIQQRQIAEKFSNDGTRERRHGGKLKLSGTIEDMNTEIE